MTGTTFSVAHMPFVDFIGEQVAVPRVDLRTPAAAGRAARGNLAGELAGEAWRRFRRWPWWAQLFVALVVLSLVAPLENME